MRESSRSGVTLKLVEATLEFEGESYPYNQMIISSLIKYNPNIISQAFPWDINLMR
jgi:hypothetical protein